MLRHKHSRTVTRATCIEAPSRRPPPQGIDGELLLSLSSSAEVQQAFWAGGNAQLHRALWAALGPLRAAAARAPFGCLPRLPRGCAASTPAPGTVSAAVSADVSADGSADPHRPLYVVVLGDTGAGKSSTLNAVIGERRLLPTNGMRACTAAIVEVRGARGSSREQSSYSHDLVFPTRLCSYATSSASASSWVHRQPILTAFRSRFTTTPPPPTHPQLSFRQPFAVPGSSSSSSASTPASPPVAQPSDCSAPPPLFAAEVEFLSAAAWAEEMAALCSAVGATEEDGQLIEPESTSSAHELWCKVKSVYGRLGSKAALLADKSLDSVLGTTRSFQAATAEALHDSLEQFVDSTNDAAARQLWPLVKVVRAQGPWEALAGGVVLVDAPGVHGACGYPGYPGYPALRLHIHTERVPPAFALRLLCSPCVAPDQFSNAALSPSPVRRRQQRPRRRGAWRPAAVSATQRWLASAAAHSRP